MRSEGRGQRSFLLPGARIQSEQRGSERQWRTLGRMQERRDLELIRVRTPRSQPNVPVIAMEDVQEAMVQSCSAAESSRAGSNRRRRQPRHYSRLESRFETNPRSSVYRWRNRKRRREAHLIRQRRTGDGVNVSRRIPFIAGCVVPVATLVGAKSQTTPHSVESVLAERIQTAP